MDLTPLFSSMNLSTSGLTAQRKRLEVVAKNLANIETTRTAGGGPYRRQVVTFAEEASFSTQMREAVQQSSKAVRTDSYHMNLQLGDIQQQTLQGVSAQINDDQSPMRDVYDPGHPDANDEGFVSYPNVDIVTEMTELISATRAFEANVSAFNASKQMMRKSLDL
ncbi:flagellar basal body rod protein FlgC [bacterium]|nr:flagellar basal body rod protein FlgC [bacterium]MBU1936943.1 flagellar basal body rod protein FlgC [bacterium]